MTESDRKETPVEAVLRRAEAAPPPLERLERIFRDHHAQVFRAAFRITGNASDAEDVLQTVFLRLLRLERGEELSDSPASYLHRAAVNAALDLVRSRRTWKLTPLEDAAPRLVEDPSRGPESIRADTELRRAIRAALADMSPKMAEIFALRYFEGYDNHEIARMLGASRSTVAVLLHRARARVRRDIRSSTGDPS
jgi:RNA polymerase sigma-70 factor (ECF subfamily)